MASTPSKPTIARRGRGGFTLVEVIIVIGIIGLLIAILLPTVASVREMAKTAQCMSNLRQIGIAANAYALANEGILVHGYASTVMNTGSGRHADAETYATSLVNSKFISAPTLNTMGEGESDQQSVFRCPSGLDAVMPSDFSTAGAAAPFPKGRADPIGARGIRAKSASTGIVVDTWYGINLTINDFDKVKDPYRRIPGDTSGDGMRLNRLTDLKAADRTVFLYDGVFYDLHYDADRINARHGRNRYTNLLLADGHAESVQTASLPGGMGPVAEGTDVFITAALRASGHRQFVWRLDQKW